jgi:hypothetical protein
MSMGYLVAFMKRLDPGAQPYEHSLACAVKDVIKVRFEFKGKPGVALPRLALSFHTLTRTLKRFMISISTLFNVTFSSEKGGFVVIQIPMFRTHLRL